MKAAGLLDPSLNSLQAERRISKPLVNGQSVFAAVNIPGYLIVRYQINSTMSETTHESSMG
jgi:hypothetical protein